MTPLSPELPHEQGLPPSLKDARNVAVMPQHMTKKIQEVPLYSMRELYLKPSVWKLHNVLSKSACTQCIAYCYISLRSTTLSDWSVIKVVLNVFQVDSNMPTFTITSSS